MARALTVEAVSKEFRVRRNRPTTLREGFVQWLSGRHGATDTVVALRDVSFDVERGESLGIIGHNGAGKSTLLRLLCGVGLPTRGRITRSGHVSGLLELGGSFHLDLSGHDNVVTAGVLAGMSEREAHACVPQIAAFAELEDVIEHPVRTYSSGMYLRLAFSVAVQLDPEVLVIDEVLAVGDVRFQQKCIDHIGRIRAAGRTLVVASHIPEQIRSLCDTVLVLDEGRVVLRDLPERALQRYDELMAERTVRRARALGRPAAEADGAAAGGSRQGTHEATIEAVRVAGTGDRDGALVGAGEGITIELDYHLPAPLFDVALSLGIYSAARVKCWEVLLPSVTAVFGPLAEHGTVRCELPALPLLAGRYHVSVGLYPPGCDYVYDYHWEMHSFAVGGPAHAAAEVSGVLALTPTWSLAAPAVVSPRRVGDG
jgi:lipopolysaccharide transport system ATP-binding protein